MKGDLSLLWLRKKGFTLIEILIAVSLLVVVAVAAFSTFRGGTAAWQRGTAHAQRHAGARAALEMMSRELSKATLVAADGAYQIDFVSRSAGEIFFTGSLEAPRPGQPDLMKVRYYLSAPVEPPNPQKNLIRATARIDTNILANFPATPPALASDITALTFEFFDAQGHLPPPAIWTPQWRTNWDSRGAGEMGAGETIIPETVGTLPDAVRITLRFHPAGLAARDFSIITELPRAAPAPFGFSISMSPSSGTVVQGGTISIPVTVELTGGTAETVNLTVIGAGPGTGITATVSPTSGSPTFNSTLTLSAVSPALGIRTIEVRGKTTGGLIESAFYTLTVFSPFDFTLSVSPSAVSLGRTAQTTSASVTATLASGAEARSITLTLSGVPAGTTATVSPSSATPTFSSILTLNITATTPLGNHTITITGTGSGVTRTTTFILSVFDFSLSAPNTSMGQGGTGGHTVTAILTAGSGTATPVTTSHGALPAGVSITGHGEITPTGSRTLTVTTGTATPLGNYTITISAIGGGITRSANFSLSVFNLASLSVPNLTILRGGTITGHTVTASLAAGSGTPARVLISSNGALPSGVTVTGGGHINFPSGSTSGSINLTVSATSTAALGNHTITVRATCDGGIIWTTTFTLSVFDFTLSVSPNITVLPGGGGTTTVTATLLGGTAVPVTLSHGSLPAWVTITGPGGSTGPWTITPTLAGSSMSLTVTTTTATPLGSHAITIRAARDGTERIATFALRVIDFSLSVSPASAGVWEGLSGSVTVAVSGHFPAGVSLSASGIPPHTTASFSPSSGAPPFNSTLTLRVSANWEAAGDVSYTITVTGTGTDGGLTLTRSATFTLTIRNVSHTHYLRHWHDLHGAHLGDTLGNNDGHGRFDHNYRWWSWGWRGHLPKHPNDNHHSFNRTDNIQFWSIMEINFPAGGTRGFRLGSDDGSRLWVGETLVVDQWQDQDYTQRTGSIWLPAGWHTVRVQYYQRGGNARVSLTWW